MQWAFFPSLLPTALALLFLSRALCWYFLFFSCGAHIEAGCMLLAPLQRLWTLPVHGLAHASCTWASSRFQPSPLFPVTPQSLSQVSLSSKLSHYLFPQTESLFILSLFTCPYILRVLVLKLLICLFICFARSFSCSMTPVIKLQHLFFPCDSDSKPSACPSECSCSFRRAFLPQPSLGSVFPHKLIYRQVWESSRF